MATQSVLQARNLNNTDGWQGRAGSRFCVLKGIIRLLVGSPASKFRALAAKASLCSLRQHTFSRYVVGSLPLKGKTSHHEKPVLFLGNPNSSSVGLQLIPQFLHRFCDSETVSVTGAGPSRRNAGSRALRGLPLRRLRLVMPQLVRKMRKCESVFAESGRVAAGMW